MYVSTHIYLCTYLSMEKERESAVRKGSQNSPLDTSVMENEMLNVGQAEENLDNSFCV